MLYTPILQRLRLVIARSEDKEQSPPLQMAEIKYRACLARQATLLPTLQSSRASGQWGKLFLLQVPIEQLDSSMFNGRDGDQLSSKDHSQQRQREENRMLWVLRIAVSFKEQIMKVFRAVWEWMLLIWHMRLRACTRRRCSCSSLEPTTCWLKRPHMWASRLGFTLELVPGWRWLWPTQANFGPFSKFPVKVDQTKWRLEVFLPFSHTIVADLVVS